MQIGRLSFVLWQPHAAFPKLTIFTTPLFVYQFNFTSMNYKNSISLLHNYALLKLRAVDGLKDMKITAAKIIFLIKKIKLLLRTGLSEILRTLWSPQILANWWCYHTVFQMLKLCIMPDHLNWTKNSQVCLTFMHLSYQKVTTPLAIYCRISLTLDIENLPNLYHCSDVTQKLWKCFHFPCRMWDPGILEQEMKMMASLSC